MCGPTLSKTIETEGKFKFCCSNGGNWGGFNCDLRTAIWIKPSSTPLDVCLGVPEALSSERPMPVCMGSDVSSRVTLACLLLRERCV